MSINRIETLERKKSLQNLSAVNAKQNIDGFIEIKG
jgi:hypothetical protein